MPIRAGILLLLAGTFCAQTVPSEKSASSFTIPGFRDYAAQLKLDQNFLRVPDATLAGQELKTLTAAPHVAGSKEDYATAQYVAKKFRDAGLETKIVSYRVLINLPKKIRVAAYDESGKQIMAGPTPEHVSNDPYQNDKRIVTAFNAESPSGDITAEAVYANYGRPQDFAYLDMHHISVRGRIVVVRYGQNFRGVKVYLAQQRGAAGVIIYSDPADDGSSQGATYPDGPYRPASSVQRGSIQYTFKYPGDPTTPGFASTPGLPPGKRIALKDAANHSTVPATPLSSKDAAPILKALGGPESPRSWRGALPFTYHIGPGPGKVHMLLQQDYALRTIWDVIGKIHGTRYPDNWVVVGNHRDAWVYGAVDPNSGTAAMLEAVHGVGALLKQGWRPQRTLIFSSWDAEEYGSYGSTEWTEQHAAPLTHAVAYFNIDAGVSGPAFQAAAVPSLKPFISGIASLVPSPRGGTVYDSWQRETAAHSGIRNTAGQKQKSPLIQSVSFSDLGGGSDFIPFLDHFGVPATDVSSKGPYGVYHSTFDDYTWFTRFADPDFAYLQEMARVLGLEAITMADADLLPYDYALYGNTVIGYIQSAQKKAAATGMKNLDFAPALAAARKFHDAGVKALAAEQNPQGNLAEQNNLLRQTEEDLLSLKGLPDRPWFKHIIYAPGQYTGYGAVVIPGVNEAIDAKNPTEAAAQLEILTDALNRAATTLNKMP